MYFFVKRVVSSFSKRQQTIAQFITKAEYYALAKAVSKAL
jgi:F0F1-type ATP synthase membrane subunit b/b'